MPDKNTGTDRWGSGGGKGASILQVGDELEGRGLLQYAPQARRARPTEGEPQGGVDMGPGPRRRLELFAQSRFKGIARLTKDATDAEAVAPPCLATDEPASDVSPGFWVLRGAVKGCADRRQSELRGRIGDAVQKRRAALATEHGKEIGSPYGAAPAWVAECESSRLPESQQIAARWKAIEAEVKAEIDAENARPLTLTFTDWSRHPNRRETLPTPGWRDEETGVSFSGEITAKIAVTICMDRGQELAALERSRRRDATAEVFVCAWELNADEAAAIAQIGGIYARADGDALKKWELENFPKATVALIV